MVKSSPLVPQNDPTLLFANAGMNQFKDVFLGREKRDYTRAASSQKCVRAGGKHNDLENVGVTARHHTFFEMLGNFSFGDYFKKEAIEFGWDFLTRDLGLPKDRLKVTIFKGEDGVPRDAEAHGFWKAHVSEDRILELGAKDNFWAMGDTGPCGPCSEIHYFQGDALPCPEEAAGRACLGVECECDRWLEIWNLVFMQYDRDETGALDPLPAPCVDTGMGLERVAAVVQGKLSNYDTDLFTPLLDGGGPARREGLRRRPGGRRVAARGRRPPARHDLPDRGRRPARQRGPRLRPAQDHAPGHASREEARHRGRLPPAADPRRRRAHEGGLPRARVPRGSGRPAWSAVEEERFATTLRQAMAAFEQVVGGRSSRRARRASRSPDRRTDAFRLYDTYGLPLDFLDELAADRGFSVDHAGFERELAAQQERARQSSKMGAVKGDPVYMKLAEEGGKTDFLGYAGARRSRTPASSRCSRTGRSRRGSTPARRASSSSTALPSTPMSGGQVGDRGVIASDGSAAEVTDTTAPCPACYVHQVRVTPRRLRARHGGAGRGRRRRVAPGAMRHHTGTHLLHAALRETLGPARQAGGQPRGSRPPPLRLQPLRAGRARASCATSRTGSTRRSCAAPASSRRSWAARRRSPTARSPSSATSTASASAWSRSPASRRSSAAAPTSARPARSASSCVTAEQGISAGTRRVEALAGEAAIERAQGDQGILEELEQAARVDRRELVDEYARLREQLKAREREIQALKMKLATARPGPRRPRTSSEVAGTLVWTPRFEGLDRKAHAAVVDEFRNRNKDRRFALVSASIADDGVSVIAAVSPSLTGSVKAPEVMKQLGPARRRPARFRPGRRRRRRATWTRCAARRRSCSAALLEAVPHG